MKILKFNTKQKFHYKRKVIIKNLLLNISVGIHDFEKNKKQKVKFNIIVEIDAKKKPDPSVSQSFVNYELVINEIKQLTKKHHFELLEDLAESIFDSMFKNILIKKIKLKIEKMEIIKETESVGIEITKSKI